MTMRKEEKMPTGDIYFYLEKLESLVDLAHIERTRELQRCSFAFEPVDHIPTVINYPPAAGEWPDYGFMEIFEDREKMLLQELRAVYIGAKLQDDRLYGIRANYGTGIIASMFGCKTAAFDDSLPTASPVSAAQLDRILEAGVPDLHAGIMGRVLETVTYFRETLQPYPKLSGVVGSQLFDIQGPFDNTSLIWGSEVFLAFYDAPEKLRRLMQLITGTTLAVVREQRRIDGCSLREHGGAWNYLGGLCVRNDSSINLSGEQYAEFVKPYDVQLLREFGGWIHFCGRAHQWWESLLDIPNLKGINPYQGEYYDLNHMYGKCKEKGIPLVQWTQPLDARCRERIRTGFSRLMWAPDFAAACRAKERLYATGHVDSE